MIGAIIGDIVGSRFEWNNIKSKDFEFLTYKCFPTDDSVMTLALAQALQGAEILVLPAAWVRGPLKEHHWSTLLAARALDTTCYMVAAGECGNKNIGQSRIIDPFGVTIAAASEMPSLIMAEVTPERVRQVRAQLPVLNNRRFAPPQLL